MKIIANPGSFPDSDGKGYRIWIPKPEMFLGTEFLTVCSRVPPNTTLIVFTTFIEPGTYDWEYLCDVVKMAPPTITVDVWTRPDNCGCSQNKLCNLHV